MTIMGELVGTSVCYILRHIYNGKWKNRNSISLLCLFLPSDSLPIMAEALDLAMALVAYHGKVIEEMELFFSTKRLISPLP